MQLIIIVDSAFSGNKIRNLLVMNRLHFAISFSDL